jgi:hypothetical protein
MRRLLSVISLSFVTAACADRVTGPAPTSGGPLLDEIPAGCVTDGVCTLEPITIIGDPGTGGGAKGGGGDGGDAGDPGGGACPTSYGDDATVQGCTGGSEPEPEPPPSQPSPAGDMVRDTIPPDCSAPDLSQWEELYCFRRMAPDSAQRRATLQALDQIAQRGDVCAEIAETGRGLLASGRITFFVWQQGDAAGYGHRNTDIQLNSDSARLYGTPGSTFEHILVHEIDHFRGFLGHIDAAGYETPNTAQCG